MKGWWWKNQSGEEYFFIRVPFTKKPWKFAPRTKQKHGKNIPVGIMQEKITGILISKTRMPLNMPRTFDVVDVKGKGGRKGSIVLVSPTLKKPITLQGTFVRTLYRVDFTAPGTDGPSHVHLERFPVKITSAKEAKDFIENLEKRVVI